MSAENIENIALYDQFTLTKRLPDWLACLHIYNIDSFRDPESRSTKFIISNLQHVASILQNDLGNANLQVTYEIIKRSRIPDYLYNIYLNIVFNVCCLCFDMKHIKYSCKR